MDSNSFNHLVRDLTKSRKETEWLEFKHDNADPQRIGKNIAAISNSAALSDRAVGYIVWGIRDHDHAVVGTKFDPRSAKIGNQELENWLATQLSPQIDVQIHEGEVDSKQVILFSIPAATHLPVRFRGTEYIRIGSYTKPLAEHTEQERALWRLFDQVPFEQGLAESHVSSDDVLDLIDYPEFFRLTGQPLPENRSAILQKLRSNQIIVPQAGDRYDVTNLGGLLFARNLGAFESLARKALRVVIYREDNRAGEVVKEQVGVKGYATGYERAVSYINDQLPRNNERIDQALRRDEPWYPEIAIRELVANALIHQDLTIKGSGPMVEVFARRVEITNPGTPLIETLRFIDEPPISRNETLASLMRRMKICEERGSGIDRVISSVEMSQLPAPDFRVGSHSTIATLYGPRKFGDMDREGRMRACYQHAVLMYLSDRRMTNAGLRKRLGIKESNASMASRVIKDTLENGWIRPHKKSQSKRDASYVPFWA